MRNVSTSQIESLEQRRMLSTVVVGTGQADAITIIDKANDHNTVIIRMTTNGVTTRRSFAASSIDAGILDIRGRAGDDTITVDESRGVIPVRLILRGSAGNDSISDASGDDSLIGGGGNDNLRGGGGDDSISGGIGDDRILGNVGDDSLTGDDGNDSINGGQGNDTMDGSAGDDSMNGNAGDDSLHGNDGDDHLVGGTGSNQIWGDAGHNRGSSSEESEWEDESQDDSFDL